MTDDLYFDLSQGQRRALAQARARMASQHMGELFYDAPTDTPRAVQGGQESPCDTYKAFSEEGIQWQASNSASTAGTWCWGVTR